MQFPNKATVERVRRLYPFGARVELVQMDDPHTTLKPGDLGDVDFVDDTGSVHVNWDDGSTLAVVYGVDKIRRVNVSIPDEVVDEILQLRLLPGAPNMFDANAVQRLANDHGFYNLVCFIAEDKKAYSAFILTGERGNGNA